jgi:hypothetical protein
MAIALATVSAAGLFAAAVLAGVGATGAEAAPPAGASKTCPIDYVLANLSWGEKCLHEGEFCKVGNVEYHAYGFDCPASGRLTDYSPAGSTTTSTPTTPTGTTTTTTGTTTAATTTTTAPKLGGTVLLARRSKASGCTRGPQPDRRCSPGAYYSGLTKSVICSASFRTSAIRNVPTPVKHAVEHEYGMAARPYGSTLEIDHIISLELGGSNVIANLFPERAPGYHPKDQLENRLHKMVCSGAITLRAAQQGIAHDWRLLYTKVFGASSGVR